MSVFMQRLVEEADPVDGEIEVLSNAVRRPRAGPGGDPDLCGGNGDSRRVRISRQTGSRRQASEIREMSA
jgi:hypothetical protein